MMISAIILTAIAQVSSDQKCDGVLVDGVMHIKEVLKRDIDSPYQFTIDYNRNTLFFSYSTLDQIPSFHSAYLNLQTTEFNIISSLTDGFASAVDQENARVFIGAKGGIFDFNIETKETKHLTAPNQNIWQMFYKEGLYYTTFPKEQAYLFIDGTTERLHELSETRATLLAISRNENIYFSNSSGLFEYNKYNKEFILLGEYVINGMNADKNGEIYFSSPDGVFIIDEKQKTVKRLLTHENIYGAAIEKDGSIVYGTQDSIIRLKESDLCNS